MTGSARPAVVVVGAGPAGLAAAAALRGLGPVLVLERSGQVAASWQDRYRALRLNSTRRRSSLPGLRIGRAGHRWLSGTDYLLYLRRYQSHFGIEVRPHTEVRRLERDGDRLVARTSDGDFAASYLVVATGWDAAPAIPDWPGLGTFTGTFLHAAGYREPEPFAGRRVLVVGSGTSAGEIAMDLVRGGADVSLAVRTPPTIFPRQWLGVPLSGVAWLLDYLPVRVADALGACAQRMCNGRRSSYLLPPPECGFATALAARRRPPMVADGIVSALRSGLVRPVAAVKGFDGARVLLADGEAVEPQAVIAATGYRRNLEHLAGHLGVLDQRGEPLPPAQVSARQPGLWFAGFGAPIGGQLHLIAKDARRLARSPGRRPRELQNWRGDDPPRPPAPSATSRSTG